VVFYRRVFGIPDGDLALSALLLAASVVEILTAGQGQPFGNAGQPLSYAIAVTSALLVALRGQWTRSSALLICLGFAALMVLGYSSLTSQAATGVAVYSCTARRHRFTAITALALITLGAALWSDTVLTPATRTVFAGSWLAMFTVAAAAGEVVRSHREAQIARNERHAQQRVSAERLRIAQELHDILGHHITGIAVQAATGLHLAGHQPSPAREALLTIRATSKSALRELRDSLGALTTAQGQIEPHTRSLLELSALLVSVRAAGVAVELHSADNVELSAASDHAAYRTVQEALTNVLRHAGAGATATVRITEHDHRLRIEVTDSGNGGHGEPGNGLAGIRNRITALGGSVEYGPGPQGGFRVFAELPVKEDT
jgi:signal transduction histidine kinase